jgi:hypothetical protein
MVSSEMMHGQLPLIESLKGSTLTLCDVHNQQYHVDDLDPANDGPDQGGMARAINQRELKLVVWKTLQVRRHLHLHQCMGRYHQLCTPSAIVGRWQRASAALRYCAP